MDKRQIALKAFAILERRAKAKVKYYGSGMPKSVDPDEVDLKPVPKDITKNANEWIKLKDEAMKIRESGDIVDLQEALTMGLEKAGYNEAMSGSNEKLKVFTTKVDTLADGYYKIGTRVMQISEQKTALAEALEDIAKKLADALPKHKKIIANILSDAEGAAKGASKVVSVFEKKVLEEKKQQEKEREKAQGKTKTKPQTFKSSDSPWFARTAEEDLESAMAPFVEMADAMEDLISEQMAMEESVSALESQAYEPEGEGEMMPEEVAPEQEEEQAPAQDKPGLMDWLMPEQQPEMAPAMTSQDKEKSMDRQAKDFPSEHDQSGSFMEVVESEGGKKQLVIKKDLKEKVSRRVHDHIKGKYGKNARVNVDFGDRIAAGNVEAYLGDGVYSVKVEGNKMDIPESYLFRYEHNLWR